jgi:hypothetical protein
MQTNSKQLISDLLQVVERTTAKVQQFKRLDTEHLNFKQNLEKWSILECIEHLNLYGDYYLPEIEKRMLAQKPTNAATTFKSGIIGNYFANLMKAEAKPGKMKSPKDKNPANSALTITTIDRFLKQQERLRTLLVQAEHIDLAKTKTAISISKVIKLRLGDTFRFLVYHIERHVKQAERVMERRGE